MTETQSLLFLIWLAWALYVVVTALLDTRRMANGDFYDDAEAAEYADEGYTVGAEIGIGLFIFGLTSAVISGAGLALTELLGFVRAREWVQDLMTLALAPMGGAVAAQVAIKGARWQRIPALALRWAFPVLLVASFFPQMQARVYWALKVDPTRIVDALAMDESGDREGLEGIHWDGLSYRLDVYTKTWPSGPHYDRALEFHEELQWRKTRRYANAQPEPQSIPHTLSFLEQFPKGKHVSGALMLINAANLEHMFRVLPEMHSPALRLIVEPRVWAVLSEQGTVRAYQEYLSRYPKGKFAKDSVLRITDLRLDQSIWERAANSPALNAVTTFLKDYPGHKNEPDAKRRLNGLPLTELVERRHVQLQLHGCGIRFVCGRVRRLTRYPLVVRVPAGLLFKSSHAAYQSMAVVKTSRISVAKTDWTDFRVAAACADINLEIPNQTVRFTLEPEHQDQRLLKLEAVLDSDTISYAVRQAMLWIVRDNASVEDLITRLVGPSMLGTNILSDSVIDKPHIVTALKLLRAAGYPADRTRAAYDLSEK